MKPHQLSALLWLTSPFTLCYIYIYIYTVWVQNISYFNCHVMKAMVSWTTLAKLYCRNMIRVRINYHCLVDLFIYLLKDC
jgi:hypothetical protein